MFKTIEIDFDVFKALTNRLPEEASTYNDVLRDVLKLPPATTPPLVVNHFGGWTWKGVTLPNGTELRANYKGRVYKAAIVESQWVQDGETYTSPSAAGFKITQAGLNGWRFWEAKRPGDTDWRMLDQFRS